MHYTENEGLEPVILHSRGHFEGLCEFLLQHVHDTDVSAFTNHLRDMFVCDLEGIFINKGVPHPFATLRLTKDERNDWTPKPLALIPGLGLDDGGPPGLETTVDHQGDLEVVVIKGKVEDKPPQSGRLGPNEKESEPRSHRGFPMFAFLDEKQSCVGHSMSLFSVFLIILPFNIPY